MFIIQPTAVRNYDLVDIFPPFAFREQLYFLQFLCSFFLSFIMLVPSTFFLANGEIVPCDVLVEQNNLANFNTTTTPFSNPILAREVQRRLQVIIEFSDITN